MQESQTEHKRHFADLDGVRGILAIIVMLHHYGLNGALVGASGGLPLPGDWGLSVDYFFMLSGFVLCQSFIGRQMHISTYMAARVARLGPAYWLSICFAWSVSESATPRVIWLNILMLQPFFKEPSINFPSWSIPFELFIPLLIIPFAKNELIPVRSLICSAFLAGCASLYAIERASTGDYQLLGRPVMAILCGAFLFRLYSSKTRLARPFVGLFSTFVAVSLMAMVPYDPMLYFAFFAASAASIYFGASAETFLSRGVANKLGRWSFSVYLFHIPVLGVGIHALGGPEEMSGNVVAKGLCAAATLLAAATCYRWIEVPGIRLGKWIRG